MQSASDRRPLAIPRHEQAAEPAKVPRQPPAVPPGHGERDLAPRVRLVELDPARALPVQPLELPHGPVQLLGREQARRRHGVHEIVPRDLARRGRHARVEEQRPEDLERPGVDGDRLVASSGVGVLGGRAVSGLRDGFLIPRGPSRLRFALGLCLARRGLAGCSARSVQVVRSRQGLVDSLDVADGGDGLLLLRRRAIVIDPLGGPLQNALLRQGGAECGSVEPASFGQHQLVDRRPEVVDVLLRPPHRFHVLLGPALVGRVIEALVGLVGQLSGR